MLVECSTCKSRYRLNDDLIPSGKPLEIKCKTCQSIILVETQPHKADRGSGGQAASTSLKVKILKGIKDLPLLPRLVMEVQNKISQENVSLQQVARMIETDPGITSNVLRIANSAYYGASGKTATIVQACAVLGLKGLSEVVMLAGTEKALSGRLPGYGYDAGDLWRHSLAAAYGSKILSQKRDPGLSHTAYIAGLIHDIGKVVLDPYVAEQKRSIEDYMEGNQKTFMDAELEFFGFSHAELAAEVCSAWKFPGLITQAIRWHHNPAGSDGDLLAYILHMADHLALTGGAGYDDDDVLDEVQEDTMSFLRLGQADLSEILFKVVESVNKIEVN